MADKTRYNAIVKVTSRKGNVTMVYTGAAGSLEPEQAREEIVRDIKRHHSGSTVAVTELVRCTHDEYMKASARITLGLATREEAFAPYRV